MLHYLIIILQKYKEISGLKEEFNFAHYFVLPFVVLFHCRSQRASSKSNQGRSSVDAGVSRASVGVFRSMSVQNMISTRGKNRNSVGWASVGEHAVHPEIVEKGEEGQVEETEEEKERKGGEKKNLLKRKSTADVLVYQAPLDDVDELSVTANRNV